MSGPIFLIWRSWSRKSSRVNRPALEPFHGLAGDILVVFALGLLDEAEHVAHPEDPAGEPVRMEDLEIGDALSGGQEGDRSADHLLTERAARRGRLRQPWSR